MNTLTLNDLLDKIKEYNPEEVEFVRKAYMYAEELHKGQFRQSGEPYITHPLNVAYILAEEHADRDTVCAGLLHDTLEDTDITKEDIKRDFNSDIAELVGLTKTRTNMLILKESKIHEYKVRKEPIIRYL